MFQAAGQYIWSNSQASLELVEAGKPLKRVTQDQDAPIFSDGLQRPGRGAFRARLFSRLHRVKVGLVLSFCKVCTSILKVSKIFRRCRQTGTMSPSLAS